MKKLAIAGAIIALSSSAFAADNSLYLKAGVIGNMGNNGYNTHAKSIKEGQYGEYGYGLTAGVGYHLMDNLRAELNGSYLFGINYKFTAEGNELEVNGFKSMVNAYVDVADFGPVKLYVGAGVGAAYMNGKTHTVDAVVEYDYKLNFAYEGNVGISYDISEGVSFDLGYKLENLGMPGNKKDTPDASWTKDVSDKSLLVHSVNLGVRFSL